MNVIQERGSAGIGQSRQRENNRPVGGLIVLFPILAILVALLTLAAGSEQTLAQGSAQNVPSVKVAFIGDTGITIGAKAVLQLIKDQNADFTIHLGDFGYFEGDPAAAPVWEDQLNSILGPDYPYFGLVGNIDVANNLDAWSVYQQLLVDRLNRTPGAVCEGDYGVNSYCYYKGLFFIMSGVGVKGTGHVPYIENALAQDDSNWRICGWHRNQTAMQLGEKADDVGWEPYELCREGGAIIATANEHSYSRTKTLIDVENQIVDPNMPDRNNVRVTPGSTFVFVSGIGGKSIRNQDRCLPTTYPYGCKGEWASIYSTDQGATHGALFIEFNYQGDPNQARGQFININGEIIDDFMIFTAPNNTAPVADDQQIITLPNTAQAITLTGSDPEGDPLTYRVVSGPSNGVLAGNAPNLTYTPNLNFAGSDSFTFVVNDGTSDSEPGTVDINVSPIQADLSFGPLLDPEDGAAGLGLAISRVFDINTNNDVATPWGRYQARLTYDGSCVNILDIREQEFSVTVDFINDSAGVAEFRGDAIPGASGPSELAQVISRTVGNSPIPCDISAAITDLVDDAENPVGAVPVNLPQSLLRGDARADGDINIADSLFIAQHLQGLRAVCSTTGIDSTCLHSLNAANWQPDGAFDLVDIGDAVSIAQHLLE